MPEYKKRGRKLGESLSEDFAHRSRTIMFYNWEINSYFIMFLEYLQKELPLRKSFSTKTIIFEFIRNKTEFVNMGTPEFQGLYLGLTKKWGKCIFKMCAERLIIKPSHLPKSKMFSVLRPDLLVVFFEKQIAWQKAMTILPGVNNNVRLPKESEQ